MMTLARVVCDNGHSVQRELLEHRYRWADFGKPTAELLSFHEFVSFVLGAPPTSALGLSVNQGWTLTDHLLASRLEQADGLIHLVGRHNRPGVDPVPETEDENDESVKEPAQQHSAEQIQAVVAMGGKFTTSETPDDFEAKLADFKARRLRAQEAASGG
jgi:hypothetical protein